MPLEEFEPFIGSMRYFDHYYFELVPINFEFDRKMEATQSFTIFNEFPTLLESKMVTFS